MKFSNFRNLAFITYIVFASLNNFAIAKVDIKHWQTKNGLSVYYLNSPEIPMLDIRLLINAGSSQDGKQSGLAVLTSALIGEDTKTQNTDEIATQFAKVGAEFSTNATLDYSEISLRTLTDSKYFSTAVQQYLNILSEGVFKIDAFNRIKQQQLQAIQSEAQSPGKIASKAFFKSLYAAHPYAQSTNGHLQSVKMLKLHDVEQFYKNHYNLQNAVIAFVGDISLSQVISISNKIEEALPEGSKQNQSIKIPKTKSLNQHIEYPSTQTHIIYGTLGIERGHPDYFPLYVGNYILGGDSVSLLYDNIREKQGLAYSVYSYFLPLKYPGPFIINAQTRTDSAQKTASEMESILDKFVKQGPSDEQVQRAKQFITGNFPLRINNNSALVNYLSVIGYYHLPIDYLDTFNDKINQVTKAQIKSAFQRHFAKNKMIRIEVGKNNAAKPS